MHLLVTFSGHAAQTIDKMKHMREIICFYSQFELVMVTTTEKNYSINPYQSTPEQQEAERGGTLHRIDHFVLH